MRWWLRAFFLVFLAFPLRAEDESLPQPSEGQSLPIDPPILVPARTTEGAPVAPTPPEEVDLLKLENDLTRARRNAASGERMFRAGIISKVESEERVLRIVRLEAKLAEARLAAARRQVDEQKAHEQIVEVEAQQRAQETELAEAARAAAQASEERQRAELEAAARNLARQKRLLTLGSARRTDVNRAQKKLTELQGADRPTP